MNNIFLHEEITICYFKYERQKYFLIDNVVVSYLKNNFKNIKNSLLNFNSLDIIHYRLLIYLILVSSLFREGTDIWIQLSTNIQIIADHILLWINEISIRYMTFIGHISYTQSIIYFFSYYIFVVVD